MYDASMKTRLGADGKGKCRIEMRSIDLFALYQCVVKEDFDRDVEDLNTAQRKRGDSEFGRREISRQYDQGRERNRDQPDAFQRCPDQATFGVLLVEH